MLEFNETILRLKDGMKLPGDSQELIAKKILFIIVSYLVTTLTFFISLYYFFWTTSYQAGLIILVSTFLIIFNLAVFLYHKNLRLHAHLFIVICLSTPFITNLFLNPSNNTPIIWAAMVPVLAVLVSTYKWGIFWMINYLFLLILTSYLNRYFFGGLNTRYITLNEIVENINFHVFPLISLLIINFYVRKVEKLDSHNNALTHDKVKNDELLHNLLPEEIAMRMKYENSVITDSYDEVTVLFADIVGFTQLSCKISPKELVDLLNVIFSALDRIVEEQGMEKIKTIGDAYMAASGIPRPISNHAEIAAEVALKFMAEVKKFSQMSGLDLRVRIGLNTGPVIAGVIGIKKTIYDLWGDTVNVAARMEHHGLPDRIQVTRETYERLKLKYSFISRGEIQVKGKGIMETYILLDKKKEYNIEENTINMNILTASA